MRFAVKPEIHVMRAWDYAYRAYRKGDYWQTFARDNERFKNRVKSLAAILDPILQKSHREKVYSERFDAHDV